MRPKKIILVVDPDEDSRSVRRFMLVVNGYRVLTAGGGAEALAVLGEWSVDLVLCAHVAQKGNQLLPDLKARARVPVLVVEAPLKAEVPQGADAQLSKICAPVDLLERVKVMIARKRGPKKGTPGPFGPQSSEASVESSRETPVPDEIKHLPRVASPLPIPRHTPFRP